MDFIILMWRNYKDAITRGEVDRLIEEYVVRSLVLPGLTWQTLRDANLTFTFPFVICRQTEIVKLLYWKV